MTEPDLAMRAGRYYAKREMQRKSAAQMLQPAARWDEYADSPVEFMNMLDNAKVNVICRKNYARSPHKRNSEGIGIKLKSLIKRLIG